MLVHLLRSHPEICSHGEVFTPNQITGITGTYLRKGREQAGFLEQVLRERDRDPIKFLYKIVLDLQGKKIVGFKLKYEELVLPDFKVLRDEIVSDLDFRIIHLRRENLLRRFLSRYIVRHVTHTRIAVGSQTIPQVPAVKLDPYECEWDFERTRKWESEFQALFARHRNFSLSYEEMLTQNSGVFPALLEFLEVSPRKLTTPTKKLGHSDLRRAIANFDELRCHFVGSPFSRFFEDA